MGAFDVFGFGQCTFDRMGVVEKLPPPDEKREIEAEHEQVGGPIATALLALESWGRRCAIAGVIGDDPEGDAIRGTRGIDFSRLPRSCRARVPIAARVRRGRARHRAAHHFLASPDRPAPEAP